jgi:predicted nucleotidyltransferase
MESFTATVKALNESGVRFLVIGVWGINHYATGGDTLFHTRDRDLFLPPDIDNLLQAWSVCESRGLSLWVDTEPLDQPHDAAIASRVIEHRAVTTARDRAALQIDLSLVMGDCQFEDVWPRRRMFRVDGVDVPVASLDDIIVSKAAAGRDKDQLFLATYKEALERMRRAHQPPPGAP